MSKLMELREANAALEKGLLQFVDRAYPPSFNTDGYGYQKIKVHQQQLRETSHTLIFSRKQEGSSKEMKTSIHHHLLHCVIPLSSFLMPGDDD